MKNVLIGVWVALLLAGHAFAADGNAIVVQELAKSTASWNGSRLPAYPSGQPEVAVLKITIGPGAVLPMHEHPVINAGVLLSGALTVVTKAGATLHLKAGDPIVEVVDTWHYGKNEGSAPAEIIVFYAGVTGTPITVKQK